MTNFVITITTENEHDVDTIKAYLEDALENEELADPFDLHVVEEED